MSTGSGRPCTICGHPSRHEIDRQLLAGTPYRKIAAEFGVSTQSLMRHRNAHVAKQVVQAAERERQNEAEAHDASLLEQARDHHKRALTIMSKAYASGDLRTALSGIREATRLLELQGKFLGSIAPTTINVLISAEFKIVQVALLGALEAFPDARQAVIKALAGIAP